METPDYFGLKRTSTPKRVPRPLPRTVDHVNSTPRVSVRWRFTAGVMLVVVSWAVGVLLGAPVLGRSVDTLFLAVGFIGVMSGWVLARQGWSEHSRRLRRVVLAVAVAFAVSFTWGGRVTVMVDGRPLPAFTEAGRAYREASAMLGDLDRLASFRPLLDLPPEQARSAFWRIEEAAAHAENIELRWADMTTRSPQWTAASELLRTSGYWMVEALTAKRDLVLEASTGRGEQLVVAALAFDEAAGSARNAVYTAAALPPLHADRDDFVRSR